VIASAYSGAEKIKIPHETLKPKDICPACKKGKVYLCRLAERTPPSSESIKNVPDDSTIIY